MAGSLVTCAACLRRAVAASSRSSKPLVEAGNAIWNGPGNLAVFSQQTNRRYAALASATTERTDAPQSLTLEPADTAASNKKNQERLERSVKKQLQYLEDPWKIAHYVEDALAKDRYDEALLLTKTAGKDRQVVVAWNHLINYLLGKQQLSNAIKLYNEMKKRGQLPNVQTYTVLFRGCARSQHPKIAVAEAVKHYNILLSDTRLQPNSIHMNAVLNVCARAGDLDSMFLIANTANESTRAPTSYTYTTILNGLRHQALQSIDGITPEQQATNLQKAVDRAKSIWTEVIDKWRKARLVIDEELVCSMGRVLLLAPDKKDKREVLDLLYQTMSIPNLAKDSGMDAFKDSDMQGIAVTGAAKKLPSSRAVYAVPGRNTLALVLTAVASARLTTCGIKYWNLLVRHYGIVPDNDNWLRLFGMLKVAKASGHASSILGFMPDEYVDPKPYRIAMETCVRDNINPNVIANANTVLESMLARLPVPDLHTLRLYLRVALVSHFQFREKAKSARERKKNEALANKIFSKGRRQSAPSNLKTSQLGGSLASRVGVKKPQQQIKPTTSAQRRRASVPAGDVNGDWTHDLHKTVNNSSSAPLSSRITLPGRVPANGALKKAAASRKAAKLTAALDRMEVDDSVKQQVNIVRNPKSQNRDVGMTIRGLAGPFAVMAQNFAPGTTAADVESAMTPVGGEMISCEIVKTQPFIIVEMVFASREGGERVIETFDNKTADGRLIKVYPKPGGFKAPRETPPSRPFRDHVVDGTMGFSNDLIETDNVAPSRTNRLHYNDNSGRNGAVNRRGRGFQSKSNGR